MSRQSPISVHTDNLDEHPAVQAWNRVGNGVPIARVEVWRAHSPGKTGIYRLIVTAPERAPVYAKRYPAAEIEPERVVYETILPRLPVRTPRCYGFHSSGDGEGWLFTEDVGSERFSFLDPCQRLLAARWLGAMHRSAAELEAATRLPDAGPDRYRQYLQRSRAAIASSRDNPGLTGVEHAILDGTMRRLEAVESRWPRLEELCEGMPRTLVHGDFRPKNVRVLRCNGSLDLCPLDWEMAGWGVPAADLVPRRGLGLEMQVDAEAYEAEVRERWPVVDAAAIRRLSVVGQIFRSLAGIAWDCESLRYDTYACLMGPVRSVGSMTARITEALEVVEGESR